MDLIFAEATPPGRGGVSVIRLSGTNARLTAERLVGQMPDARHAYFRTLRHDDEPIDQVLAMWFPEGQSFTGDEVAELHLHGAPVISRRVGSALLSMGARPAEAGEFTRRAFLNGRMDLAEIEGLGDLLAAETEAQRKLALRTASGELAQKALEWRQLLIEAGALVEVSVDFADEDVPDEVPNRVFEAIAELREALQRELAGFSSAERIRMGFEVAIIGPPNAGKSSLLNRLAQRDVAIVSDREGTTRDVIELKFDLNGLPVTFLDTAGLRESDDAVERIGIDRALNRAKSADLRIHLSRDGDIVQELWHPDDVIAVSHADIYESDADLTLSAVTGHGIDKMLGIIGEILRNRVSSAGLISHERQRLEIITALDAVEGLGGLPAELIAEKIRVSAASLDRLLGRIGADDYLDVIFSSFCIGK
ncbi:MULTISPECIES: tRNA uridine-5-carboxymethylaminomethyl(34) synthesis GTPase MnmE [Paracoccus]|uniref:tRNA modification GTPase MnmE n=1 Tax=Paracoccus haeundaensis TaxID=225362 RepID=A0A5C4R7W5_9RHOB|nr:MULTISPECIES: tRNA uridine-5-carboxymethylaminomethyl(34) synthesis GTPase MnmE [Paracoccus]KIX17465.1 tRNA modification GTPase TrmE [Paracoccus sp. 228]TNH40002.1 tRNA uridine-5-carboxymethylaminomethyl(34) synthesis GTPase MnmE [Paracoccus haeundaensis]